MCILWCETGFCFNQLSWFLLLLYFGSVALICGMLWNLKLETHLPLIP